ncbi:dipeptide/oligopeptide/nickel ABC transporter permease/ATP-binding protein [Paenarthrobacter sp. NPDC056912]|uniref:dipeptide/oligopeptide/nickel ABC transporter permease/ATP-binding protein n=1 Tax=Paenarthrobacter sp. NPDC056912 TaxID=3345965 RepID=UPI0036714219
MSEPIAPARPKSWLVATLSTPAGIAGTIIVVLIILTSIFAPLLFQEGATTINASQARLGPSLAHPFGTDELGRDIMLRVLVASRLTLVLSLSVAFISGIGGITLGILAAVLGPVARQILVQVTTAMTAFPTILLSLLLATLLGRSGWAAMLGLAIAGIPTAARLTLGLATSVGGSDVVASARVIGVPSGRLLRRYILPNIIEPLLTIVIVNLGSALLVMSALSFLGVGVQPPEFDWGQMLSGAIANVYTTPMAAVGPALAIVICGIGFSLFGEALAKGIDPRNRIAMAGQFSRRSAGTNKVATRKATKTGTASRSGRYSADGSVLAINDLRVGTVQNGVPNELVHGVDLVVRPGERIGIVGESGSGKSLTLSAIGCLLPGSVTTSSSQHVFLGENLSGRTPGEIRKVLGSRIATVFQDPMSSLNPALTIGRQMSDKLRAHTSLSSAEIKRKVIKALADVRIPDPERRYKQHPHELSGGQRQRVMIAMATLGDAQVILADEPTTALDVSVQAQVIDLLLAINRERGTAIVLVSHDLALVSQACERIVVMYDGRVVEEGPMEQVIGNPRHPYTRMLLGAVPDLSAGTDERLMTVTDYSWNTDAFREEYAKAIDPSLAAPFEDSVRPQEHAR